MNSYWWREKNTNLLIARSKITPLTFLQSLHPSEGFPQGRGVVYSQTRDASCVAMSWSTSCHGRARPFTVRGKVHDIDMMDHPQLLLLLLFHFSIFTPISGICTFPTQKNAANQSKLEGNCNSPTPTDQQRWRSSHRKFLYPISRVPFFFFFSWPFGPGLDRQKEIKVPREGGGADPPPPPTFVCSFPL